MSFLPGRRKNYFALSFSDQEVQLVQGNPKGKPVLAVTLKLEPGLIERGRVKKPKRLAAFLEKLLASQKLKSKFVAVGLSEEGAFSRVLTLPDLPPEELDDAVRWQIEPLLPMDLGKAYLDWMLLEKAGSTTRVLVMAFPAKLVEDYALILESLGFQPVAFEPVSLSLARLLNKDEKSRLIIEIRDGRAVLVVVGPHGEIELTSTVFFKEGGSKEELFSTITSLLGFYKKKVGQERGVAKIFLCGRKADQSLAAEVKGKTSLETELVAVKPIELASAVSLARKDVAAPIDEKTINLVPPRIQGVYDLAEKSRLLSKWIKLWLFSLFLILFAFGIFSARVFFDLNKIEGEIIELQASITPEAKLLEASAKTLTANAARIISLADSQEETVSWLGVIQTAAGEKVTLTHYSIDFGSGQILVNGLTDHRDELLAFRENLERSGQFAQVRIPLSSLEMEKNINFTISLLGKEENQKGEKGQ